VTRAAFTAADVRREVEQAGARIRPHVRETLLEPSPRLGRDTGAAVFLKMENLQVTGSFKARGAFSKLLSLTAEEKARGVVTASSGNHGVAMAHAMNLLGVEGEIWLADQVSPAKLEALRSRGAAMHLVPGGEPGGVELLAKAEAARRGATWVSPYNDAQVIGGQGTIAVELLRQVEAAGAAHLDAVFVPVGGGGLIAGIAGYLKAVDPSVAVVGCLPASSPVVSESVKAGEIVDIPWEPSLSDATVGLVEPGAITLPICIDCVDDWVLLEEQEIATALRLVIAEHSVLVEGAAVLSVAALLKTRDRWVGKTAACVLSGSRIPLQKLAAVLAQA
jgi:threonine dehydratase